MTQNEIIRMAREAGAMFDHMTWVERDLAPVFERFAALVAAHERKNSAKMQGDCTLAALKLAEEALESCNSGKWSMSFDEIDVERALAAIREALADHPMDYDQGFVDGVEAQLAEPVKQEPVARFNWNEGKFEWLTKYDYYKHHMKPLYLMLPTAAQAARQMRDTAVKKVRYLASLIPLNGQMHTIQIEALLDAASSIAALPIPGEDE